MNINDLLISINNFLWGWPLIIVVGLVALIVTIALQGVQFRYFLQGWRFIFSPAPMEEKKKGDMSPFQAFVNALSASLGNGSLAGMATAVAAGGPGAAFWVFVLGLFSMALRFSEVYLSVVFGSRQSPGGIVGGPMVYLSKIPGGLYLPYVYAFFCLLLSLVSGNAMQANSIRIGVTRIFDVSPWMVAVALLIFITYVVFGGARRIVAVSDRIVPLKVGLFFGSAIIVLAYHYIHIIPAVILICKSAFSSQALIAGSAGFAVQYAIRYGMSRSLNASEAGLGTAAVLFGGSDSKDPVKDGILGMIGTFISANLVCYMLMLIIVATGVWNNGQDSIDLTISAYETVFGSFGAWLVTFLTMIFGLGVLVAYAYIGRACWLFLTNGRLMNVFTILFCATTFFGAIAKVDLVWNSVDLVNAGLLLMNLFGIVMLLPTIRRGVIAYAAHNK